MNSILQMDLEKTFGSSSSNVTLPISARPECEGQVTKPKLYLYTNFGKMQSPKSANSTSQSLNDVSKSTNKSSCRSLGSSGVLNSPYSTTNNTLNISTVTPDPSRLSTQLDNLLSNSNVKSCTPGPDEGLEDTSDPRLCPRVLVDVDLPIQRPKGSNCLTAASAVNNYLITRTSTPLHSNSGINCEKSGKKTRFKEWRNAKEQQLDAYKAWVNSQLRKRPDSKPINDLRTDLRDGQVLATLIEIVGNEKLYNISTNPDTREDIIHNIDIVLQFVQKNKIRVHEMTAQDIVDGNLKCIMRLILALAAHYKPSSVKHSSYHQIRSPSCIAQEAAVALSEARRNAARAGHRYRRTRESAIADRRHGHRYQDSSSEQFSDSDHSERSHPGRPRRDLRHYDASDGRGYNNRLSPRCYNTPVREGSYTDHLPRSKSLSIDHIHAKDSGAELEDAASVVDKTQYDELLQEYTELGHSMQETKTELIMLQELLLRGEDPEGSEDATASLIRQLHLKDKCITSLKHDIVKLQDEITQQIHEKEKITSALKSEIRDLHDQMQIVGATGASLSARVASQDKRMARLEGKIFQANPEDGSHSIKPEYQNSASELHIVRDSLQSLRHHFEQTSPHNHTIDTLEQSIALLIEKLHTTTTETSSPYSSSHTLLSSRSFMESSPKKLNYDSAPERQLSSSVTPTGYRLNKQPNKINNKQPPDLSTNVLYFTDTSVTPKMCKISKILGEIKLRDFKKLFDRPSMYRYHFKALDPEYGTVKEEVANDDDIIPGWEGKIVAWVEADLQTEC